MSVWFVSVFPIAITQTGRHSHNTCCKIELINKLTKPDVIYLSVDSWILLHGASARKLDCNILVAGDFNLSKMDWDHMCPSPDCKHPSFYRQITEVLNDSNLTQTVSISTRDSNILDLFFTTNPTLVQRVSILQGISNLSKSCISLEQPPLWNCGLLHLEQFNQAVCKIQRKSPFFYF